jgi:putative transcriptional regulator
VIKYKIDVADALARVGFSSYTAKKSRLLSQNTMRKIRNGDTSISLQSLDSLCLILGMDLGDIVTYEMSEDDRERREQYLN